ncbi:hypothetical protein I6N89_16345 [Pelagibaca abyssi]|nr:hypothetical protein [Salipiger abyssi]
MSKIVLTPTRGIVAAIAAFLAGQVCNATARARFKDFETAKNTGMDYRKGVVETGAELMVPARCMQPLGDEMRQKMSGRIITIHSAFLPSFKGAALYKKAFERRVKLIGAISHYLIAGLAEGPIIEQDRVLRMTQAQSPGSYVSERIRVFAER